MKCLASSLVVCCIGSLIVNQAWSEEVPSVIVSATRSPQSTVTTPASITIITHEQIQNSGAQTLADVLRTQTEIQVRDLYGDGSRTAVSMRGFSSGTETSNTLILVDGRRLNNADLGGPDLNSISLKDVERVEVIQGSAGSLFGDQAVGGVINIITRNVKQDHASLEAGMGSYASRRLSAQLNQHFSDNLKLQASAEAADSDNYREHNQRKYRNAFARLDYQQDQSSWFAELSSVHERLQLPGALTASQLQANPRQANPAYPDDNNDTDTQIGRVGTRQALGSNLQLEAELTHREQDIAGIAYATAFSQSRQSTGVTPRLIHSWSTAHGDALLTVGIDYEENDYAFDSSVAYISDVNARQNHWALYTQLVMPLTERLTGTVGARYAQVDNHIVDSSSYPSGLDLKDHVSVGEIGLSWQLHPQWRVFMRRDGNFRFAKIDEQTYTSAGTVGLRTQTGASYELGTEWRNTVSHAKLLAYRLDLDNEIGYDTTAPGPGIFPGANINLPPTQRKGLILEVSRKFSPKLALTWKYTYIDATITGGSFTGNKIPYVAEKESSLVVDYQLAPAWHAYAEALYTGPRFQDSDYDNSLNKLPGITVYNLHLRYRHNNWRGGLRINNAANKQYVAYATYDSYYPAPGRSYELYAGYRF